VFRIVILCIVAGHANQGPDGYTLNSARSSYYSTWLWVAVDIHIMIHKKNHELHNSYLLSSKCTQLKLKQQQSLRQV